MCGARSRRRGPISAAQQENLRDAQVTVAAEVARNYFELRGTQKRLDVARQNLASEDQTQQLTQLRYDAGRVTELDVQQSRARLKAPRPPSRRWKRRRSSPPTAWPCCSASVRGRSMRS